MLMLATKRQEAKAHIAEMHMVLLSWVYEVTRNDKIHNKTWGNLQVTSVEGNNSNSNNNNNNKGLSFEMVCARTW